MKNYKKTRGGYTLIEVLVSISVFTVICTIILSILSISFRGSKKSELLNNLKQNGNTALTQMVKTIRYAKSLDSPLSCTPAVTTSFIKITSLTDGGQTTYSCPAGNSTTITSSSAALSVPLVDVTSVTVSACSFTCIQNNSHGFPSITINFTLNSKNANSLVETTGSIPFNTSVSMRNYNP